MSFGPELMYYVDVLLEKSLETIKLKGWQLSAVEGPLVLASSVRDYFLAAPYDLLPNFEGPAGSRLRGGRGKDHPRYGRYIYAFAKHYRPELVVEVGSYAGGTAIGWGKALTENGRGRLISIDNDTYSRETYPAVTQRNLQRVGVPSANVEFRNGDSKVLLPTLARELKGQVDIFLVDADHTYEGALADIENGLPMVKPGGFILVHDVDRHRRMDEMTPEHPTPVYEAFHKVIKDHSYPWCILKFIRKHLGVIQIPA
jgi:predicted O-methyltransferase YrrM